MRGIELSEAFYNEFGAPMIKKEFPDYEGIIAAGIAGSGSECFGYDDEISHDHDFEPGFCLFIPDEDVVDRRTAFLLERAYAKLPKEYMGVKRPMMDPVGGNRRGVIRISDFFMSKTGFSDGKLTLDAWFSVPEYSLAEAVNGKVFRDDIGFFTDIRNSLLKMPRDVRLKKLSGELLLMGQSGQYNYSRCMKRHESGAAQFALNEFVKSTMHAVFLLNDRYMPYYKWSFRAFRELPLLSGLSQDLEYIISSDNCRENYIKKCGIIENTAEKIIVYLQKEEICSSSVGNELEKAAYSVNGFISDGNIRNKHILYGI